MGEYTLPNTGDQVAAAIARALSIVVPTYTSQLQNDSGFVTAADVPTKTSQLQNDSGFVLSSDLTTETTRAMTEEERLAGLIASVSAALANYYTKSETYNKTEVNNLIGAIQQFHYEISPSLASVTNPQSNVLYLIGPTGSGSDKYEEYVYANSTWTKIGDTTIDLSGYPTTEEVEAMLNSLWSDVLAELNKKANKDGWYEQMAVGLAENLVDTAATGSEQTIRYRKSGGPVPVVTSNALIKGIKGRTDAWNMLAKFNASSAWSYTVAGVDITHTANSYKIRFNGQVSGVNSFNINIGNIVPAIVSGHKYYISGTGVNGFRVRTSQSTGVQSATDGSGAICTASANSTAGLLAGDFMAAAVGHSFANYDINVIITDLTLAYGSGKEPTTVDAFLKDYPYALGASYNAGKLLGNKVTALVTDGFNQWDEVWEVGQISYSDGSNVSNTTQIRSKNYIPIFPSTQYYFRVGSGNFDNVCYYDINKNHIITGNGGGIKTTPSAARYVRFSITSAYGTTYQNDICINLSDASVNGTYEPYNRTRRELPITTATGKLNGTGASQVVYPNGMNGVGTSFDEIVVENGLAKKGIRRRARVDLGSLTWTLNSTKGFFYAVAPSGVNAWGDTSVGNAICSRYTPTTPYRAYEQTANYNKCFSISSYWSQSNVYIVVIDSAYATAAAFKTAMNGVMLDYQLATPQTFIFDTPFSVIYPVHANGTEEATPIGLDANGVPESTPFVGAIAYQKDYVKQLNELPDRLDEKQDVLTFDETPTEGSTNPVTSGGVKTALDGKANPDGYYQQMVSGAAESLIAKELSDAVISYRATPSGTGAASIAKIKGRTDAWNQVMKPGVFGAQSAAGVTITDNNDGTFTVNGTANGNAQISPVTNLNLIAGHKYAYATIRLSGNAAPAFGIVGTTDSNQNGWTIRTSSGSGALSDAYFYISSGASYDNVQVQVPLIDLTRLYGAGREPATAAAFLAEYPEALTAPYNAGKLINNKMTALVTDGFNQWNEVWESGRLDTTTGADYANDTLIRTKGFMRVLPNTEYYCYFGAINGGTSVWAMFYDENQNVIAGYSTGIGVSANASNISNATFTTPTNCAFMRFYWFGTTYANDIAINLSHSGIRNGEYEPYWTSTLNIDHSKIYGKLNGAGEMVQIAPDGFRGVGSNYDEVDIVRKEAYIRRAWVDMGTLNWTYQANVMGGSNAKSGFYASVIGFKNYSGNELPLGLCVKYPASSPNALYSGADKAFTIFNNNLFIADSSAGYDPAAFKTAMDGVMLDYQLATPLHYTDLMYSEDGGQTFTEIPSNYRVDDFGTERRLPDGIVDGAPASTPLVALINYPINLPKTYQNQDSMDDFANKLASALGFTWSKTWNGVKYVYTITKNS